MNLEQRKPCMKKPIFVKKFCEKWYEGLSERNIVFGFATTGICLIYKKKYPEKRFGMWFLSQYNKWVAAGKPEDLKEDLAIAISTPVKAKQKIDFSTEASIECSNNNYPSNLGNNAPRLLDGTNSILNLTLKTCYCDKLGEVPAPAPTGFKWVPRWELVPDIAKASTPIRSG